MEHVELYPNPVENTLSITSSSLIENIKVFSVKGSLIINLILSESRSASINVENLKSGVYLGSAEKVIPI